MREDEKNLDGGYDARGSQTHVEPSLTDEASEDFQVRRLEDCGCRCSRGGRHHLASATDAKGRSRRATVGDKRAARGDSERAEPRPPLVECLREGVVMMQCAAAKTLLCMMPTLGIVGKGVAT